MAVRPDYKQTDVGVIPEDWTAEPLGELSEFITSGSRGWAAFYSDQGALFIRSQNVRAGRLDFDDTQFVSPPKGAEGNRTRVRRNDLLITITGNSVGNVALVDCEFDEAYISQHVGLVRLSDASLGYYVSRFLSPGSPGNNQIWASQSGQSKPGLTLRNLQDFWVALPPSEAEQQAIATALSDVDALLDALGRLIGKKRDLKQAAMQQLLSGQKHPTAPYLKASSMGGGGVLEDAPGRLPQVRPLPCICCQSLASPARRSEKAALPVVRRFGCSCRLRSNSKSTQCPRR